MNKKIDHYEILSSIGKGGMGEVFLVHDSVCGREVALKKMREQWVENKTMQERFLREARIAAQLSHPSIIPIHAIDPKGTYYTMPHIAGETLREIIRTTKQQSTNGESLHPIGSSVPALIRIFLSVCGAIAYSHSRGVLHRDLKPENIIVGKYGEVILLDWGLADFLDQPEKNGLDFEEGSPHLTQPGKIPGTLLYMAPERAFGAKSSIQTDIYSLGVVLYQMLTLQFPYQRSSIKEFRKRHKYEEILDPEELAPDREISPQLSTIARRCLAQSASDRYASMEDLIQDLENYIEGLPQWIPAGLLDWKKPADWQFQENVILSKHRALIRGIDLHEWVNLMLSKSPFPGNCKIETELTLHDKSKGLGIIFCSSENTVRKGLEEGYLLWISDQGVRLYRSNVEVYHDPEIKLENNRPYGLRIEKIDNHVRFYLDGIHKFGFISHIPLAGSYVGLLMRDANFSLSEIEISVGSQNIMVNCLAVPDAFLAKNEFAEALQEYRKISESFPGRAEGREATFRAGITLIRWGEKQKRQSKREALFSDALEEFEKLHHTAGAPLEYLGKSLVYKAQNELEEEAKCLELALRKFPKHPLKPILVENILSRLHELTQIDRKGAYLFALMTLRHLPHLSDAKIIIDILEKSLEPLPFFQSSESKETDITIQLAFWLNKPMVLVEMLEKGLSEIHEQNAKMALYQLGHEDRLEKPLQPHLPKDTLTFWKALEDKDWEKAGELAQTLPKEQREDEKDPLFFLYGCFLAQEEGEEAALAHLSNLSEKKHPPIPGLLSHYLIGRINLKRGWIENAFFWEKQKLFEQLSLYAHCLGDEKLQKIAQNQLKKLL